MNNRLPGICFALVMSGLLGAACSDATTAPSTTGANAAVTAASTEAATAGSTPAPSATNDVPVRPVEDLSEDTIEPTAARTPSTLAPSFHGRDTRYPLFAGMPQGPDGRSELQSVAVLPVVDGKPDFAKAPDKYRAQAQRTWGRFVHIVPSKFVNTIAKFEIGAGAGGGYMAVGATGLDNEFGMTVATRGNMDHIIVHEFGHLLADRPSEYDNPKSLTLQFTDRFHNGKIATPAGPTKAFYETFVTGYAASDTGEDLAESFRYFVFLDKPTQSDKIVDQKILLFWEYPEYVEIRAHIRRQLGMSA